MPERASEEQSWAPWHRSVHAVPVRSLTQQRLDQRGGALPRLAVAAATGKRAQQRAARCRCVPSPAPWAVFSPSVPALPNKRHKQRFVLRPRAGSGRTHNPHQEN